MGKSKMKCIKTSIILVFIVVLSDGHEIPCKKSEANKIANHFLHWYERLWRHSISNNEKIDSSSLKEHYYKVLSRTEPFTCILQKSVGGRWENVPDGMMKWCEQQ